MGQKFSCFLQYRRCKRDVAPSAGVNSFPEPTWENILEIVVCALVVAIMLGGGVYFVVKDRRRRAKESETGKFAALHHVCLFL
ncbi:MAG: hypothetical protein Q9215_007217 [Flavoplaca cf. flavocitrina]